ncbi:MAG: EpsG family protein [Muribaculaceae bacterium]|nr:EpsG family protein [Muribaculaceae bacterium]
MDNVEYVASIYSKAYYIVLLILSICAVAAYSRNNRFLNVGIGWPLAIALILFLAFRPLTFKYGFGDTPGYAFFFEHMKSQTHIDFKAKDLGYEIISFSLRNFDVSVLFMFMGALYVVPQLLAAKRLTPTHYGILFLIIVCSFSFWGYGVNGMRNGAALALVMLGMVRRNVVLTPVLFVCAASIHGSALLPICAYCINFAYRKPATYMKIWCVCVVLSMFVSNMLTDVLPLQDLIEDKRVAYLSKDFTGDNSDKFSSTGYRWDFVLYSAIPVILGYRKIVSGAVKDRIYIWLYNTYCMCNAFWLFTIYVPYNNRFAYLSWFLYPILVAYPFMGDNNRMTRGDESSLRKVIGITYLFTFIMWLK